MDKFHRKNSVRNFFKISVSNPRDTKQSKATFSVCPANNFSHCDIHPGEAAVKGQRAGSCPLTHSPTHPTNTASAPIISDQLTLCQRFIYNPAREQNDLERELKPP